MLFSNCPFEDNLDRYFTLKTTSKCDLKKQLENYKRLMQ